MRQPFGAGAGLAAALVLAIAPIAVATVRDNTLDGRLAAALLLAAGAVWPAVESGRARYLFVGAVLAGQAFNIKRLQGLHTIP